MSEAPASSLLAGRGLGKNRIEALADGIFAVAMTLLVLDVKVPADRSFGTGGDLLAWLASLVHNFAMYAISFCVLAIFWLAHHLLFHYVRHVGRAFLWLNMAFLLLVTFVPFSTDLMGDHGHLVVAVLIYGGNLFALGLLLALQLRWLATNPAYATPDLDAGTIAHMRRELRVYALIPLASAGLSLHSPRLGTYVYLLLLVPALVPGRLDRLLHPGAARGAGQPTEEP